MLPPQVSLGSNNLAPATGLASVIVAADTLSVIRAAIPLVSQRRERMNLQNLLVLLVGVARESARFVTDLSLINAVWSGELDTAPCSLVEAVLEAIIAALSSTDSGCHGRGEGEDDGDDWGPHCCLRFWGCVCYEMDNEVEMC